jgi:hypothetical protein
MEGFHPIPFLRDRTYLDGLAAADRAEAYRIVISLLYSRVSVNTTPTTTSPTICRIRDPLYP